MSICVLSITLRNFRHTLFCMQAHKNMCLHTYTWDSLHFFLAFKVWCFRIFYIATYTSTSFIRLCNSPVHGCYWCWYGLVLSWYRRSCKLLAVVEDGGPRLRDESQLKPCLSFLIGQWDKNKQPAAPPPWNSDMPCTLQSRHEIISSSPNSFPPTFCLSNGEINTMVVLWLNCPRLVPGF